MAVGGLYQVSIDFDQSNQQVKITWGLNRPSDLVYEDKSILLDHVSNAEFAYFGTVQHQTGWHTS